MNNKQPIVELQHIKQSFRKSGANQELLVIDDVSFSLYPGEVVALLGKSGSGKSTLLRIIAGLIKPSSGQVMFQGQPIYGPVAGISMVFQHFALMPWLTVLQNVELGLEAQGVEKSERRKRALEAIDIVGLDGFESAYPKELSGGMRQRVGFARALVVNPDVLLMDEPFSALDVLTADNLRNDLMDLWQQNKTKIKSILIVTHNIEEAALLADRILIFGVNPGNIKAEIGNPVPHPRESEDAPVRKLVDDIYTLMTTSIEHVSKGIKMKMIDIGYRLPKVGISQISGLIETLHSNENHSIDLPELADELSMDMDDLFPITEAAEILRFARVSHGDIELSPSGNQFAAADMQQQKQLFARHLLNYVPLARHIRRVLDERPGHRASEQRFLAELEDHLSEEAAEETLEIVIGWARYAELFAYDYNTGVLSLENPE